MTERCTLIHWFRKGLRVHDNPALKHVFEKAQMEPEKYCVRPIYVLDPNAKHRLKIGANRQIFLQQSLENLDQQLSALNSRLYVVRGNFKDVFQRLFEEWKVELLTFEEDIEPYNIALDKEIRDLANKFKVEVITYWSHTVYNPYQVIQKNLGKAPSTYQKFLCIVESIKVPVPKDKPEVLQNSLPPKDSWEKKDENCYCVSSMEHLVKNTQKLEPLKFLGGETEALKRLNSSLADESWVVAFEKPKTYPNSLEPSTTVLSPYLKFGCLSSRLFYKKLSEVLNRHPKHSKPPVSLMGQLMWREFYYTAAAYEPNFDRMMGNSFCLQIPWQPNDEHLQAWALGRTGYPFIDAVMRQLRQEGWIHHLARHAVACFLTRGDLWISWEDGQKVFEELLLDHDWALNAGNWMWLSASAFFYQYYRVYSPVAFGKKTDRNGAYIRKYVPELAQYPAAAIYEPWKMSLTDQNKYGCVLGKDYPHRIVDHDVIHKENIKRMSAAYKVNREVRTGKAEDYENSEEIVNKRKAKVKNSSSDKKRKKN